jgi:hypothetical protein
VADPLSNQDRIAHIKNPLARAKGGSDFDATIRGVRKNLILLDFFIYNRKSEPIYQQTRTKLAKLKN